MPLPLTPSFNPFRERYLFPACFSRDLFFAGCFYESPLQSLLRIPNTLGRFTPSATIYRSAKENGAHNYMGHFLYASPSVSKFFLLLPDSFFFPFPSSPCVFLVSNSFHPFSEPYSLSSSFPSSPDHCFRPYTI